MDASTMIEAIVDKHASVYRKKKFHYDYDDAIKDMAKVEDLADITVTDVVAIIQRWLYGWGTMGRVLGREEYSGWQGKVTETIKKHSSGLQRFKKMDIQKENLSVHKIKIKELFNDFKDATEQIASAKILHLICPSFFPMWDTNIANATRFALEDSKGYSFDKSIIPFSGGDYFQFMKGTKDFMLKHYDTISLLSNKYQHNNILRTIDVCFLLMVRRPLYLVFQ